MLLMHFSASAAFPQATKKLTIEVTEVVDTRDRAASQSVPVPRRRRPFSSWRTTVMTEEPPEVTLVTTRTMDTSPPGARDENAARSATPAVGRTTGRSPRRPGPAAGRRGGSRLDTHSRDCAACSSLHWRWRWAWLSVLGCPPRRPPALHPYRGFHSSYTSGPLTARPSSPTRAAWQPLPATCAAQPRRLLAWLRSFLHRQRGVCEFPQRRRSFDWVPGKLASQ